MKNLRLRAPHAGVAAMVVALLGATTSGCGPEIFQSLVEIRPATEDECAFGGQVVEAGLDLDEDGTLDADEVDASTPVCNGEPGEQGEQGLPGTNALVRITDEPAGANCAEGGVRIEVGLDDNGNGTLDDNEITATSYVCDGITGLNSLVRTSEDPEACGDLGGILYESGVDDNGDGVLDDTEVDGSSAVCNGQDGETSLIEISPEPAGPNCSAGGQQIITGLDSDGNGVLEGVEIDDTVYICDPIANLVSVSPEIEGDSVECPNGGSRIDTGLDSDGNGVLDTDEISSTSYVCTGDDGLTTLVLVTDEPAGANCDNAGKRVETGLDANDNGTLDVDEVSSTNYVCNGEDGADGQSGSLVRVSAEAAGANCATGGTRIDSGPDSNFNGVLDDDEITDTSYSCNGNGFTSLVEVTAVAPGVDCVEGGQLIEVGLDTDVNGVLDPAEVTSSTFVCNGQGAVPFAITEPATLPTATANQPFDATLTAVGGTGGDYAWSVSAGALPDGLTLDPTGTPSTTLSGTPTTGGTFMFTIDVEDFFGQVASLAYTMTVDAPLLAIETFTVPQPEIGTTYSTTLSATGGTSPYTWAVEGGTLPTGLTLAASTGVISGTPTAGVPATVLIEVTDSVGETRAARLTFHREARWAAFGGEFITDGDAELGINNITAGTVGTYTTINPTPVVGGDLGQTSFPSASDVMFSTNGDRVSFTGDFDVDGAEELWWVDLSTSTPGTATKAHAAFKNTAQDVTFGDHEWSPDGRFLAFRADDVTDSEFNLYLVDTEAKTPTAVQVNTTLGSLQDVGTDFVFSPDSRLLAYESDETTNDVNDLYVVDVTAILLNPDNVTNNGATSDLLTFKWSADSSSLLYVNDGDTDGVNELYLADVAGGTASTPQRVNPAFTLGSEDVTSTLTDYQFSPDGSRIFYFADANVDGLVELNVVETSNLGVATVVSHTGLTNTSQDVELAEWTPDSRGIVFASDGVTVNETEIFYADATGALSTPIRLNGPMVTNGDIGQSTVPSNTDVAIDPQNRGVYYRADEDTDAREDLYFARFDDPGNPTLLTSNFGASSDVNSIDVSTNGSIVVFNGDPTSAVDELYGIDMSGATPGTPQLANKALVTSGDVDTVIDTDWFIVGDGEAVVYVADADTDADDEAYHTTLDSTGAAVTTTTLNPALPTSGDITTVYGR